MVNALIAAETGSVNLILRVVYSLSDTVISPTSKLLIAMVCRETVVEIIEDIYGTKALIMQRNANQRMLPGLKAITPLLLVVEKRLNDPEEYSGEYSSTQNIVVTSA